MDVLRKKLPFALGKSQRSGDTRVKRGERLHRGLVVRFRFVALLPLCLSSSSTTAGNTSSSTAALFSILWGGNSCSCLRRSPCRGKEQFILSSIHRHLFLQLLHIIRLSNLALPLLHEHIVNLVQNCCNFINIQKINIIISNVDMDLLGDIGQEDQLTSAREENRVLQAKVKELTVRVHELNAKNAALLAEVELYRAEFASKSSSGVGESVGEDSKEALVDDGADEFVTAGNGSFAKDPAIILPNINGISNPLCCALHPDDNIIATGGADNNLILCRWGIAFAPGDESSKKAVDDSIKVGCGAPVICTAFAQVNKGRGWPYVAAGCMDGSVTIIHCGLDLEVGEKRVLYRFKHEKYVKTICWSPSEPIIASASADGNIKLHRLGSLPTSFEGRDSSELSLEAIQSMHFDGPVEAMCFVDNGNSLCCYVRGTSYLTYFDLTDGYKQAKYSLNGKSTIGDRFDDHVSFSVLSLQPSPNGKYVAAATDASRNIIVEANSNRIVRNLYGHKNDVYSTPKIAWSSSGQYLYGNSQNDKFVCVWDIASSSMVKRLEGGAFVRDIYSSKTTDTVATVSFDKTATVWLNEM